MKQPGTNKIVHRKNSFNKKPPTINKEQFPAQKKEKETQTSWGKVSSWYEQVVEDEDSYQAQVIAPNLVRLVGDIKSKNILDLACGEGYFTRLLASSGGECTGVDISKELIALAEKKDKKSKYIVTASHDLSQVPKTSIDTVICILALQNIEKIKETILAVSETLKKSGTFVFVLNHPSFRNPKQSDWHFDTSRKAQGRVTYEYMTQSKIKIDMTPGQQNTRKKEFTISFHRPLQFFVKELTKSGFVITGME